MTQIDFDSPDLRANVLSKAAVGVVAVAILGLFFSSYSVISPGNTGVIFNVWTGSLRTVPQGIAWRMPFITQVQSYPTALRTYTMVRRSAEGSALGDDSIDLPTREGQHITQDISVTFNTSEDLAAQVFKAFRGADIADIEATFIRRTIITVAQNTAGQMDLSEVISAKRNQLQDGIQRSLSTELEKMGFHLDKVNLGASHLPQSLEVQMQQKMAASSRRNKRSTSCRKPDAGEGRSRKSRRRGPGDARPRESAGRSEPAPAVDALAKPDSEQSDRQMERHTAAGVRRSDAVHRSQGPGGFETMTPQ